MNRYLFLDIDGVLNHEKFYQNRFNLLKQHKEIPPYPLCEFDPFCVEQVNRILDETNANLVISSSWRFDKDLKNILKKVGLKFDNFEITPYLCGQIRGLEIKKYIDDLLLSDEYKDKTTFNERMHPEKVIRYCILDDDSDMLYEQRNYFVQTNAYGSGLTKRLANKVIRILNKE